MSNSRHALLIANQEYRDNSGFTSLKCPLNDARELRKVLSNPKRGGFKRVEIIPNRGRRKILVALSDFLDKLEREDLAFIYFSGHGKPDEGGNLYFAARDTHADKLLATGVNARDIAELIRKSKVKKKALVLDCCYAGAFPANMRANDIVQDRANEYAQSSGTYVMMAAGELELAQEDPETGLSVYAKYLIEGLEGAADDKPRDGLITISKLSQYVSSKVAENHNQKPREAGRDQHGEILIGRSGFKPEEEIRDKIIYVINDWFNSGAIDYELQFEALRVLNKGTELTTESDKKQRALLEKIIKEKLGSGTFMREWLMVAQNDTEEVSNVGSNLVSPPKTPLPPTKVDPPGEQNGVKTQRERILIHNPREKNDPARAKKGDRSKIKKLSWKAIAEILLSPAWAAIVMFVSYFSGLYFSEHMVLFPNASTDANAFSAATVVLALGGFIGLLFARNRELNSSIAKYFLNWLSVTMLFVAFLSAIIAYIT